MSAADIRVVVPMSGRSVDEPHRGATPLELLFDLTFVIAIARLTSHLGVSIAQGHATGAIAPFLQVFFAIWWAWMNFTWFASSYDADDVPYRLLTMLQMAGVLVLAAGIPAAFEHGGYTAITVGYLVMRIGLGVLWARASRADAAGRATARRYLAGIAGLEVAWATRLVLDRAGAFPEGAAIPIFVVLVACELAVPLWAERPRPTQWHPYHVAERHGLFTIIVLGECVLAASTGFDHARGSGAIDASVVAIACASLVLVFAMWWLYFLEPCGERLVARRGRGHLWGYGQFGVFAALAALGAGLEVAASGANHGEGPSPQTVGFAVAIPVAVFLVILWAVNAGLADDPVVPAGVALPAAAITVASPLAASATGLAVVVTGVATASAVGVAVVIARHARPAPSPAHRLVTAGQGLRSRRARPADT